MMMVLSRELIVEARYINLPVRHDAPKRRMRLVVDAVPVREFDIELAEGSPGRKPDFWVFSDVSGFLGKRLTLEVEDMDPVSPALQAVSQSETFAGAETLYRERYRPQFHFSSRRGWNNDPVGLLYYQGTYHLFYQHNPYGCRWGNMHWGHAVSPDLVHWHELGDALYPNELGTIFSGSGVVDWKNTAGFQRGAEIPLVCIYTSAGDPFTQSIAYSTDGGRTWANYAGNPVLAHVAGQNRDPKVIWHEPTRRWVMALYLDGHTYALFSSPDLKEWKQLCQLDLGEASECPDLFELPVDGEAGNTRWVFWGADGSYLLGSFDGQTFQPHGPVQRYYWGGDSYAAQTWSDIPVADGRRIQMAWLRVNLPGMSFNQCMAFPSELTLRTTPDGIRLFSQPVREIALLRHREHRWEAMALAPGDNPLAGIVGDLFDIRAEWAVGDAAELGLVIRGIPVAYDARTQSLTCQGRTAPLQPVNGRVRLQVLVDRASIEVFGNDGHVAMPLGVILDDENRSLEAFSRGGSTWIESLEVYELRSAWG
jgi:fructan beta-fructosidase